MATEQSRGRLRKIIRTFLKYSRHGGMTPASLKSALEELGPTFVKMGQIMSTHPDLIPPAYCKELGLLRSEVAPMPAAEVRRVIETAYHMPMGDIFEDFDETPLGSASIAQAHSAHLKNGDHVVVKVQREGIYDIMEQDIRLLKKASPLIRRLRGMGDVVDFNILLDELWESSREEMDFTQEAQNGIDFRRLNEELKYSTCPRVYEEFSTKTVLILEYVGGYEIDDIENLEKAGYDMNEIGTKLVNAFAKQIIEDGFFHADPHQGNIRIEDGVIVWIDMGMMGRLSVRDRLLLSNVVEAFATYDIEGIKSSILTIGVHDGNIDHAQLYADVENAFSKYADADLGDMDIAEVMDFMFTVAKKHHISIPSGVTILARGIATLEGVLAQICPDISVIEIMSNAVTSDILGRMDLKADAAKYVYAAVRSMKKTLLIPTLVSDALTSVKKGQTKLNLEISLSPRAEASRERQTGMTASAILIGAVIIGSCLLCTTDMEPKLFGAPAIGMIGFLAGIFSAAVCGITHFFRKNGRRK